MARKSATESTTEKVVETTKTVSATKEVDEQKNKGN